MRVVPRRTVVGDIDRRFDNLSGSHHQSHVTCVSSVYGICVSGQLSRDVIHMTLMMTSAQVVETSVNVTNNSPSQGYSHPDDQTTQTTETPGFKPFTIVQISS